MFDRMTFDVGQIIQPIEKYGKVVYLLGKSEFGPIQQPVKINSDGELYKTFGKTGSLIDGYKHLMDIAPDCEVRLCKVTGMHSSLYLNVNVKGDEVKPFAFILKAAHANSIYDKIKITIYDFGIAFDFPIELGGGSKIYYYSTYEIFGLLIRAINQDTMNGENHVFASLSIGQDTNLSDLSLYSVNPSINYLVGGDSGLGCSKDQYYNALEKMYGILGGQYVDIIVPLGAFIDDVHPKYCYGGATYNQVATYSEDRDYLDLFYWGEEPASFHKQLMKFCRTQQQYGFITHGVIGFNKISNPDILQDDELNYIMQLVEYSPIGSKSEFYNKYKIETREGALISPVLGDFVYSDGQIDNAYVAYAGMLANTMVATSTTNKPLGANVRLATAFSTEDLKTLSVMGIVSFRISPLKGLVVSNGVTLAPPDSDLHYICNVRMIQLTVSFVNKLLDKFIGEDYKALMKDKVIDDQLGKLLTELLGKGVLKNFKFKLVGDDTTGNIDVMLDLQTLYMVEYISTSSSGL